MKVFEVKCTAEFALLRQLDNSILNGDSPEETQEKCLIFFVQTVKSVGEVRQVFLCVDTF